MRCSSHAGFRNGSKWGPMPGAELCTAPLGTASLAPNRRPSEQGLRATLGVRSPKEKMSRVTGAVHAQLHPLQQSGAHTRYTPTRVHPFAHSYVCEECPAPRCSPCTHTLPEAACSTTIPARTESPSHTHAPLTLLPAQHSTGGRAGEPVGSGCSEPLPSLSCAENPLQSSPWSLP